MKISKLIPKIALSKIPEIHPEKDKQINGVSHDSRSIKPGDIFVAFSGGSYDGHDFVDIAIEKGAIAVVGEKILELDVPYLLVENARKALAQIAAALHEYPARKLNVIGVTGTDGKTTTVNLIHHVLTSNGIKTGMVSTVNASIGKEIIDTGFHVTTPDAHQVQTILKKMVNTGLTHVVLEATSHGLAQHRVNECYFDGGVITNITHEHLDYHGDYAGYLLSKSKLLTSLNHGYSKPGKKKQAIAIINKADSSYQALVEIIANYDKENIIRIISYGNEDDCDIFAENIQNRIDGIRFDLVLGSKKTEIFTKLIGEYNVYNILATVAVVYFMCGIEISKIVDAISKFPGVPGRMEVIDVGQPFTAIVDFAHTPNALKVALAASRKRTKKRVIAVFGSAGLRDREKRRLMAKMSVSNADITIITAEDPRTEDLQAILEEMKNEAIKHGGVEGRNLFIVPDRGAAIDQAVNMAEEGDLVIACGKGHEQSMCFGITEYPWDDRIALRSALASLMKVSGPEMPYLPTQK